MVIFSKFNYMLLFKKIEIFFNFLVFSKHKYSNKMSTNATAKMNKTETPKKKSWAEMADEADDEERIAKEEEEEEKTRKIIKERKYLLSIGQYELEDGEILE